MRQTNAKSQLPNNKRGTMKYIPRFLWIAVGLLLMAAGAANAQDCTDTNTGGNAVFIIQEEALEDVPTNATLRMLNESGMCYGSTVYDGSGSTAITAWRNDTMTTEKDGFDPLEPMVLTVNGDAAIPTLVAPNNIERTEMTYMENAIYVASTLMIGTTDEVLISLEGDREVRTVTTSELVTFVVGGPFDTYLLDFRVTGADVTGIGMPGDGFEWNMSGDTLTVASTLANLPEGQVSGSIMLDITGDEATVEILDVSAAYTDEDGEVRFADVGIGEPASSSITRFLAGDVLGTGTITAADRDALVGWFIGTVDLTEPQQARADIHPIEGDGVVDVRDLHRLAEVVAEDS